MSIRPEIRPYQPILNGAMSGNITGAATVIQKVPMVGYSFIWSAGSSPTGTLGVQVSNDFSLTPTGQINNAGTWTTYYFLTSGGTYATTLSVSGNNGNAIIELPNCTFYAVRPIYTFASGGGTLNAFICGKVN